MDLHHALETHLEHVATRHSTHPVPALTYEILCPLSDRDLIPLSPRRTRDVWVVRMYNCEGFCL